jgi:hypothetical protein
MSSSVVSCQLSDLFLIQFLWSPKPALVMDVGAVPLTTGCTSLCRHVGHVVGMRTEEEMIWVHASPVVALVEHKEATMDRTTQPLPGHTSDLIDLSIEAKVAIAAR